MCLLHYIYTHAAEYGITLSALNCDHKIRKETSARDSAFVKEYCKAHAIPIITYEWAPDCGVNFKKSEANARFWRHKCYIDATRTQTLADGTLWQGVDAVATAHHLDDNAETVLFNLARGSYLSGLDGITDFCIEGVDGGNWSVIHPLVCCSRAEIDNYVDENNIPYVDDETNFTDDYTRNKIRHNVLPELEKAVPGAAKSIFRFSRLAADDEEYFDRLITDQNLVTRTPLGAEVKLCKEKVVFKRAILKALRGFNEVKDYTSEHAERLYNLQFSQNGKRFEFLNFVAFKEEGKIALCHKSLLAERDEGRLFAYHFGENFDLYMGQYIKITDEKEFEDELERAKEYCAENNLPEKVSVLKFDLDKIPTSAVIRFMANGDKFTKFGGGTKSLGNFFTDRKIPVRIRKNLPLIAADSDILAVCGVEISDKIKIDGNTKNAGYILCPITF